MKKSVKDQTAGAFQVGGYVAPSVPQQPYTQPNQVDPQTGTYQLPGTGIAGYQVPSGAPTGYTPYGGATPYFQPVQFTGAQYQTTEPCLLYTSPSPRDGLLSRMPSSA